MPNVTFLNHAEPNVDVIIDTDKMRIDRMRARLTAWAYAINDYLKVNKVRALGITLTYVGVSDYREGHIKKFMNKIKWYLGDDLLSYAWVAEMQTRLAVHYHICLIIPEHVIWPTRPLDGRLFQEFDEGTIFPHFDTIGFWPHGMTRCDILKAVSASYLTKYAQKGHQKAGFPPQLRLFACVISKSMNIGARNRFFFRLSAAPGFVRVKVNEFIISFGSGGQFDFDNWKWKPFGHYGLGYVKGKLKQVKKFFYDGGWEITYNPPPGTSPRWLLGTPAPFFCIVESDFQFLGLSDSIDGGVNRDYMED